MKSKKGFFGALFYKDKFVVIFSIVCALIFWVVLAFNDTETIPRAITDITVTLKLSDAAQKDGLTIFVPKEQKVRVTVKGNSLAVNALTSEDITVEPQMASSIVGSGQFTSSLVARKKNPQAAYEIVSTDPQSIILSVDYFEQKDFPVNTDDISGQVAEGYYTSGPTPSKDTVNISGPQAQVNSIARVAAETFKAGFGLTETKRFTSNLILYDANGNKISPDGLTLSVDSVDVTIAVLMQKTLPLVANFTNQPSGLKLSGPRVTVDPPELELAAMPDVFNSVTDVNLPPIDFSSIDPINNVFSLDVTVPTDIKNLSAITKANVRVDLSGFDTRVITVTDFRTKNAPPSRTAKMLTKSLTVTVVGPTEELSKLTETNLAAFVDLAGHENSIGPVELPANITISSGPNCWAYGTYMANVSLLEK